MKRKIILITGFVVVLIAILLFCNRQTLRGYYLKSSISNSEYYQTCLNNFESIELNDSSIIFVGNSLLVELNLSSLNNPNIRKLGIRGDLSTGLRNRFDFMKGCQAEKVFIELGINDILNGIPFTIREHKRFVKKMKEVSPSTKIYIHSITPTLLQKGTFIEPSTINLEITESNKLLKDFCLSENITYIDLYNSLELDGQLNSEYTRDGVHLNDVGNTIWLNILKTHLSNS